MKGSKKKKPKSEHKRGEAWELTVREPPRGRGSNEVGIEATLYTKRTREGVRAYTIVGCGTVTVSDV